MIRAGAAGQRHRSGPVETGNRQFCWQRGQELRPVATRFHSELRRTKDPTLKAALLASSFASTRRRNSVSPELAVLGEAMATPLASVPAVVHRHRDKPCYEYLKGCYHRDRERSRRERGVSAPEVSADALDTPDAAARVHRVSAVPASAERAVKRPEHTMEPDIAFDAETSITTISIWSRFDDVSASEAATIIELSRPCNWAEAVPTFFLASDPVELNVKSGKFELAPEVPADVSVERRYRLREYVEWAWTPSTQGGIVNILDIHELAPEHAMLDAVALRVQAETKTTPIHREGTPSLRHAVSYTYALDRCLQSKFVSNWEPGGLDVDQGHFTATWDDLSQTLWIEAVKEIRYSRQADVVPGFSSLLNLLAPAVTSMLMKHLAYEGVVHYLETERQSSQHETPSELSSSQRKAS
jgi:hypothetical protein